MLYTDPTPRGHCLYTDQKYFSPATDDRQGDTGPAGSLRLQLSHNRVARALLPLSNWGSGIQYLGSGIWDPYRRDVGQKLQPRGRQRVDAVEITEITDSANKFHFDLLLPAYLFR